MYMYRVDGPPSTLTLSGPCRASCSAVWAHQLGPPLPTAIAAVKYKYTNIDTKIDTNTTHRYRWITHVDPFRKKGIWKKEVQHLQKDRPKAVMTATPKHIIDRFGFLWYRLWGICGISASFMWSSCGQVQEFEIGIKMLGRFAALGQWGTWS